MYLHDIPQSIFPKFADDLVSISVNENLMCITSELQSAVDELVNWSHKWGMLLNVSKTKVTLFGNSSDDARATDE